MDAFDQIDQQNKPAPAPTQDAFDQMGSAASQVAPEAPAGPRAPAAPKDAFDMMAPTSPQPVPPVASAVPAEDRYAGAEGMTTTGFEQGALPSFAGKAAELGGRILEAWTRGLTVTPVTGFEKEVPTEVPSKEQFAKEHPYASGIAETVGEKIGGMIGSPEYFPILAMPFGSAAPFLIRAAISAGFTEEMARSVFSQSSQAGKDWDNLDMKEKVKRVTSMAIDGAMAGVAASHTGKLGAEGVVKGVEGVKGAAEALRPKTVKTAGVEAPVSAPHAGGTVAGVAEKFTSPGAMEEYQKNVTKPQALKQAVSTVGQPMHDAIEAHKAVLSGDAKPPAITGTDTPAPYKTFDEVAQAGKEGAQPTWDKADNFDAQAKAEYEKKIADQKQLVDDHNKQVDAHNAELGKDETPLEHVEFDPEKTGIEKPELLSDLRSDLQQAKANTASADPAVRQKAFDVELPKAQKAIDNWFKQHDDIISPEEYESVKNLNRMSERMQDIANQLRGPITKGTVTGSTLRGIESTMDNRAVRWQGSQGVGTFKRLLGPEGYENWQRVAKLFDPVGGTAFRSVGTYALEYLAAHILGPMGLAAKFGTELLLNRILFDKTWGGWFSRAADAVSKTRPAVGQAAIPDALVEEGKAHLQAEISSPKAMAAVAGTKLSQGPAPAGGSRFSDADRAELGKYLSKDEIDQLEKTKAPAAQAPQVGEGVGGHEGGGVVSAEELARPGKHWMMNSSGQPSYEGSQYRPEATPQNGAHVTELPDGSLRVNEGNLTPTMEKNLRAAMAARDTGKARVGLTPWEQSKSNAYLAAKVGKEIGFYKVGGRATIPSWARDIAEQVRNGSMPYDESLRTTLLQKLDEVRTGTKLSQSAPAPAGARANEPVSLADWDTFRGSHPISHEMIQDAFPGQEVIADGDRNFRVNLENGNMIQIELNDTVDGGEVVVKPGNAVLGRWDTLDNGGVMQLAGISGEQTLRHETFHAAMDILPKRIQEALINKYGDEEAAADAYGEWKGPEAKSDSLLGQVRDYFSQLYDKVFKPALAAFREIHEGKVWQRAAEKFQDSNDLRPNFSVKTYPKWEKDFRKKAAELGATPREIENHIKAVAPAPKVTHSFDPKAGLRKVQ